MFVNPVKSEPAANRLLAALPGTDRRRIEAGCEPIELEFASVIIEPRSRMKHVYFPTASFVSLTLPVEGRVNLEVGLVGREGMVGVPVAIGVRVLGLSALVQGSGSALRMPVAPFVRELERSAALQRQLHRYLFVIMSQLAQSIVCNRFHVVESRLARWLLMTRDRAGADTFSVTHEFLAFMLGVRRVGVTNAAGSLQRRKLISYSRGEVSILDGDGLAAASCPCYEADLATYARVMGPRV